MLGSISEPRRSQAGGVLFSGGRRILTTDFTDYADANPEPAFSGDHGVQGEDWFRLLNLSKLQGELPGPKALSV
jgi:hypothetical protein